MRRTITMGESNSCLILGPRGTGKTMVWRTSFDEIDRRPRVGKANRLDTCNDSLYVTPWMSSRASSACRIVWLTWIQKWRSKVIGRSLWLSDWTDWCRRMTVWPWRRSCGNYLVKARPKWTALVYVGCLTFTDYRYTDMLLWSNLQEIFRPPMFSQIDDIFRFPAIVTDLPESWNSCPVPHHLHFGWVWPVRSTHETVPTLQPLRCFPECRMANRSSWTILSNGKNSQCGNILRIVRTKQPSPPGLKPRTRSSFWRNALNHDSLIASTILSRWARSRNMSRFVKTPSDCHPQTSVQRHPP